MAKKPAKSAKKSSKSSGKFNFIGAVYEGVLNVAETTRTGAVRIKRADLKQVVENAFQTGMAKAAGGERVRFPVIGALVRREVKARKGGKGVNPFTGETIDVKARPASKKPR